MGTPSTLLVYYCLSQIAEKYGLAYLILDKVSVLLSNFGPENQYIVNTPLLIFQFIEFEGSIIDYYKINFFRGSRYLKSMAH